MITVPWFVVACMGLLIIVLLAGVTAPGRLVCWLRRLHKTQVLAGGEDIS
jgi:hypothetical protein